MTSSRRGTNTELPKNRKGILEAQIKNSRVQLEQKLTAYRNEIGEEYPIKIIDVK